MLDGIRSWVWGSTPKEDTTANYNAYGQHIQTFLEDVYLPDEEVRNIHERIRRCLDDTADDGEIDHTLRLMRDETEKWYHQPEEPEPFNNYEINNPITEKSEFDNDNPEANELVGYCMRLERNNAYLLQLIESFEQVSFKKRYNELLLSNTKLEKEYNRLKSTNGKIYTSYCDLLEEIKKVKADNELIKSNMKNIKGESREKNSEVVKLKEEISRLKLQNDSSNDKLRELRKSNMNLQRSLTEKDNEISKMKGINIATKLKLERAENVILKSKTEKPQSEEPTQVKTVNPPKKEEIEEPEEIYDPEIEETQDTIALLFKKYQSKAFMT